MNKQFIKSIRLAKSIDIHAHAVLDESMGAAGEHGPELTEKEGQPSLFRVGGYELHGVKYRDSALMDVDKRIAGMLSAGIDFQILSPNPLTYFHYIDAPSAISFCKRHNDVLVELVKKHPEKHPMKGPIDPPEEYEEKPGDDMG